MPTSFQIKQGDTLSKIAQANGTTVDAILAANKGNASVKSANLIIAGGSLNLPDKVAAPAAGPAAGTGVPTGGLDPASQAQDAGSAAVGEMGNLRMALRSALNEAAKNRVANNYGQLAGAGVTGVPGTIGSVVDMIRAGAKPAVETTFEDIMTSYKDATEAKQKELDRINALRLEYGSAIPASVTSLQEAINLVAPLVDADRREKLKKTGQAQAEDDDIQSWAESYAKGEVSIGSVPTKIRTAVKVAADAIRSRLETEAKNEYSSRIAFRLEKKTTDFETERSLVLQDENLTVAEQREMLDYVDSLETAQKSAKKQGKGGFFSFLSSLGGGAPEPAPLPPPPAMSPAPIRSAAPTMSKAR